MRVSFVILPWKIPRVVALPFVFGVRITPTFPAFPGATVRLPAGAAFALVDTAVLTAVIVRVVSFPIVIAGRHRHFVTRSPWQSCSGRVASRMCWTVALGAALAKSHMLGRRFGK